MAGNDKRKTEPIEKTIRTKKSVWIRIRYIYILALQAVIEISDESFL